MLTIIGPYPTTANEMDGMVKRVQKIDGSFEGIKRIYLVISFTKLSFSKRDINADVTVYWMNFFLFFWYALYFCLQADVVYVHSIYNSLKILPIYFFHKKIITDMHGVVVEEIKMNKKHNSFMIWGGRIVYKIVEKIAVNRSRFIIAVTNTMKKYFVNNYYIENSKVKVIPIFDNDSFVPVHRTNTADPLRLIYSGGTQPWQCTDETIELIKKTSKKFRWTILSGNTDYWKKKLADTRFAYPIEIKRVSPSEIKQYYLKNDCGVVLRKDNIVNRVACPTKLIDYLQYGLIPIVLSPHIGDFYNLGYKYIEHDEIMNHLNSYSRSNLNDMAIANYRILTNLCSITKDNFKWLNHFVREGVDK